MGNIRLPEPVCLICAVCRRPDFSIETIEKRLQSRYGLIDAKSEPFIFEQTQYYTKEMGENLQKHYLAFVDMIDPAALAEIKCFTNALEDEWRKNGDRVVNIDPGYIELPKLILASSKNYAHRIYIGKGIYGDVQLVWRKGKFIGNPWTYPDYLQHSTLEFFTTVRNRLHQTRMESSDGHHL
ncbi:DUF4416 family protein [candidate division KSB1 bacterium]|nr:DUF4416 family protein [candidate division KSB1 bacterium]